MHYSALACTGRATALSICVLIAACATPQDARNKGAVASYMSKKTAKDIAACVATAWESDYGVTNPVSVRPTAEGFTLQISANGNTMVVLDVSETGTGSESKYFKGNVLLEGKLDRSVKACQ